MVDDIVKVNDSIYDNKLYVILKRKTLFLNYLLSILDKICKRIMDIVIGMVGVLLLIPVSMFVCILKIVMKDKGPIFFVQQRIGKNGKIFKMIKYRTMILNAEEVLNKMLEEDDDIRREYDAYKKIKHDPRMTKLGGFLRRTSLDEFPQFLNVLLGNMSMVGPRPYLPAEQKNMGNYYYTIIKCKPGITGLWQVSGRNNCSFCKRLEIDMEYYERRNFILDIGIFLKTVIKVVKSEGAL